MIATSAMLAFGSCTCVFPSTWQNLGFCAVLAPLKNIGMVAYRTVFEPLGKLE